MSCELLDRDQSLFVLDYGPLGFLGTESIVFRHGLEPGAIISAVTKSSNNMEINIKDVHDNRLLHIANRADKEFVLNTLLDEKWSAQIKIDPLPVQKGCRTVTTLLYQKDGYRVFINGKEIAFYGHRSTNTPHLLHISHCQIYKIVYLTIKDLNS